MTITIYLHPVDMLYYARHEGVGADQITELFGTADIPTPYSFRTPLAEVVNAIRERNPEHVVYSADMMAVQS